MTAIEKNKGQEKGKETIQAHTYIEPFASVNANPRREVCGVVAQPVFFLASTTGSVVCVHVKLVYLTVRVCDGVVKSVWRGNRDQNKTHVPA